MLLDLLTIDVYKLFIVFARWGAAMMYLPGFLNANFYSRARLLLALAISWLMMPILAPLIPPMPESFLELALVVAGEVLVGLFFGLALQALLSALDLAGSAASFSVGLAAAQVFDSNNQQQNQILSSFMTFLGVMMIFITNTHHLMLQGVVESYRVFIPGQGVMMDDMFQVFLTMLLEGFRLGMALVAPMMVFALTFNASLGAVNRLVPQMQVFFVAMPLQIIVGLIVLMVCLASMLYWFMEIFIRNLIAIFPAG